MLRYKDIKQLHQILLMRRLVACLLVLKSVQLLQAITKNQSGNLIEEADEQGQVNSDYIYLGNVPIARVDEWWENMPTPQAPTGVTVTPGDKQLTVTWNANAEPVDGYKVYWGTESGKYTSSVDVGKVTSYTITGLTNSVSYYIAVKAYADLKETYFYHVDYLGTPILMTNGNGTIVWEGELLPFGERNLVKGSITNNLGMPGQYYDVEKDSYYNYYREYDYKTGRFTMHDPSLHLRGSPEIPYLTEIFLKTPQKLHPYVATLNNPIRFIDPYGLDINSVDFTVDLTVVGAGQSIVWCCDKNKKRHRATYHKICYGLSIGANAASFGAPLTERRIAPQRMVGGTKFAGH